MSYCGSNYDPALQTKDIAARVRAHCKKHWPGVKFSVTSNHSHITIVLLAGPFSPWADITAPVVAQEIAFRKAENPYFDPEAIIRRGDMQINHYGINENILLSKTAKAIFTDVRDFVMAYNYDNSDIQTDYFDTRFYLSLELGRYDRPFVQTGNSMANTSEIREAA